MDNSNIKVYLGISFALIILFVLIIVVPFSKKPANNQSSPTNNFPTPTSVEVNSLPNNQVTNNQATSTIPADFTGVAEEELPPQVLDAALQKKDLRQKTPLDLTTFVINFDYSEDKFVVTLKDPKDQAQREFEGWRVANYPGLGVEQFLLK